MLQHPDGSFAKKGVLLRKVMSSPSVNSESMHRAHIFSSLLQRKTAEHINNITYFYRHVTSVTFYLGIPYWSSKDYVPCVVNAYTPWISWTKSLLYPRLWVQCAVLLNNQVGPSQGSKDLNEEIPGDTEPFSTKFINLTPPALWHASCR